MLHEGNSGVEAERATAQNNNSGAYDAVVMGRALTRRLSFAGENRVISLVSKI